nr:arogenate dehydratase/prephenate dehydratase 1, chloroplastic [Tanacetum cinerariifolium]
MWVLCIVDISKDADLFVRVLCIVDISKDADLFVRSSPRTYNEIPTLRAYPMCETVPCDQIDSVSKAI